ncbi:Uma2 family endonuclease [Pendulispora brunnea]|uniref:Uma2 family endonuclease n=1 Tax=Pendulispora brunnea TaxID=2905690 RepID=A0ABZ2KJ79_9BACT
MSSAALDLREIPLERQRRLRRVEYEQLVELGVFKDERVELLYGVVVKMSPIGPPHNNAVARLNELLVLALVGRGVELRPQSSFAASDDSEPEPDFTLVPRGDYRTAHPAQAYLVIEVAQSSLKDDRAVKARLYAEAGVPEYWIVNLVDQVVEVHRKPASGRYESITIVRAGESLDIEQFPDVRISVDAILGR